MPKKLPCQKCSDNAEHAIQIREGDPSRSPTSRKPDKSKLSIVRLCQDHWEELRLFMGLPL